MNPKIAIIGGSGVYDPAIFKKEKEIKVRTPFGNPSDVIEIGEFCGQKAAFLARHGKRHQFPPHKVPQKANIWALKKLGIERVIGICAVGSLKDNFKPGQIAVPDQFIDYTKNRDYTFYDKGAVHTSLADPFCADLRKTFISELRKTKGGFHSAGTYLCVEGPRFSTRAESKMFRRYADVIGMTLVPEAVLAREQEMCYVSLAMITDYDCWQEKPVEAKEVIEKMKENLEAIKKILTIAVPKIKAKRNCFCKTALEDARL